MRGRKGLFKSKSIKIAFIRSILACIASALLLSLALSNALQWGQSLLYRKYAQGEYGSGMVIGFGGEEGEWEEEEREWQEEEREWQEDEREWQEGEYPRVGISYHNLRIPLDDFSPRDLMYYDILGILSGLVYPICFLGSIVGSSILFYRRQLQEPLAILGHAARQIADSQLDFQISYQKEDELGELCASFEKMRQALKENNEEMWRQMEERQRLNHAFSHDLRTPLTVLKGQSELLMQYAPKMTAEKVSGTAEMMHRHIERLEAYVKTMSELQRLEDIEIQRAEISLSALCRQLGEAGEALCGQLGEAREALCGQLGEAGEGLCAGMADGGACPGQPGERKPGGSIHFSCHTAGKAEAALMVDAGIVLRVFENLVSNALRFAQEEVEAILEAREGCLFLTVSDDGSGFAEKDLEDATKPFYKTAGEAGQGHFGMGLNICKILCEKHGGGIRLSNEGGATVRAVFRQR